MADGKKTFIFYSDWINMVREMPNEDAGSLLKHILSYVNDEDPETDNLLVKMAFGHMKPLLKADLDKWDIIRDKRKEAGSKGGKANAKQKVANAKQVEAVNVNVNVNANETVIDNKEKRKTKGSAIEIIFPFDSENFKTIWEGWKNYKKADHKFSYKSPISELAALKKLAALAGNNEKTAIEIIEQSLANGWKGFFKLDTNDRTNQNRSNNQPTAGKDRSWRGQQGIPRVFS